LSYKTVNNFCKMSHNKTYAGVNVPDDVKVWYV